MLAEVADILCEVNPTPLFLLSTINNFNNGCLMTELSSPFHRGERAIQSLLGVREQMEGFGRRVIRDHMPEQHREFYQNQNYLYLGHVDSVGWPWASMLFSENKFISSADAGSLELNVMPILGDPLGSSLTPGLDIGILGIELHSRRRNRLSAAVTSADGKNIGLKVKQSFGNCPQYIQQRYWHDEPRSYQESSFECFSSLDADAKHVIANADTFFVASHAKTDDSEASNGADISHRGGKPGFVRVDDRNTLTIPDYLGNFHFNTLGNFLENPKAGLLFIDFERGHILQLTGRVDILWQSDAMEYFQGAERLWTFVVEKGRWLRDCLPKQWSLQSESPNNRMTGSWDEADQQRQAANNAQQWQNFSVGKIVQESASVRSFYFSPPAGQPLSRFQAGQFLSLRASINGETMSRTYTVSNAPGDEHYRISVKRDGVFSHFLHDQLELGEGVEVLAPQGDFVMDTAAQSTALLFAAGIGITPMLGFIRDSVNEAIRARYQRPIMLVVQLKNRQERCFYQELEVYQQASQGRINVVWCYSQDAVVEPANNELRGRINADLVARLLSSGDVQAYLCGPAGFMQSVYQLLFDTGLADEDIFAEAFGPAALKKHSNKHEAVAEHAAVQFSQQGRELSHNLWQAKDGSLLEFAEQHGLSSNFSCRSGRCGSCRAKLVEGRVSYAGQTVLEHGSDEVLLCCAKPAAGCDTVSIELPAS